MSYHGFADERKFKEAVDRHIEGEPPEYEDEYEDEYEEVE